MEQNDFLNLLRKYRRGHATPEEKKLIDAWYASMGTASENNIPGDAELQHLYRSSIYPHLQNSRHGRPKKLFPWYSIRIAASILIMVVAGLFFIDFPTTNNKIAAATKETPLLWKDISNTTTATQSIILPDGSNVALEPESKLKFSAAFNTTKREVYLEGEAFFEVSHNANIPFFVHANEVTTKVLGTSFTIKAIKHDPEITVVVKTGKVSVFTNVEKEKKSSAAKEIILTPNQQIVYDKEEKEISKMIVKTPQVIIPEEEVRRMRFAEAPVTEIFKALEKMYGVDIEFDEALLSSCRLTTVISNDGLYSRLNIICNVVGTSYTLEADRIVISGSGCKVKM
jgi:ferric-dicitrate binding protein FerR (iron transport regulator)